MWVSHQVVTHIFFTYKIYKRITNQSLNNIHTCRYNIFIIGVDNNFWSPTKLQLNYIQACPCLRLNSKQLRPIQFTKHCTCFEDSSETPMDIRKLLQSPMSLIMGQGLVSGLVSELMIGFLWGRLRVSSSHTRFVRSSGKRVGRELDWALEDLILHHIEKPIFYKPVKIIIGSQNG